MPFQAALQLLPPSKFSTHDHPPVIPLLTRLEDRLDDDDQTRLDQKVLVLDYILHTRLLLLDQTRQTRQIRRLEDCNCNCNSLYLLIGLQWNMPYFKSNRCATPFPQQYPFDVPICAHLSQKQSHGYLKKMPTGVDGTWKCQPCTHCRIHATVVPFLSKT